RPGLSKISSLSYLDKDDHPDRGAHPGMGRPPPRSGNSDRQMDKATFANQLRDCGLLFNRRLARAVEEWSPRVPDGRTLARELIRQDLLTPYQANQLLLGKGQALVVGQYRLMERLGEGNLGQLFKAVHVAMDRLVTVRLLPPQLAADPVVRAQFNHIVHTLAQLNHPNILSA